MSDNILVGGDAQALIKAAQDSVPVKVIAGGHHGAHIIDVGESRSVHDISEMMAKHAARPRLVTGTSVHESLDSLATHASRYRNVESVGFVSPQQSKAVVVYDYYNARDYTCDGDVKPEWRQWRAEWTANPHESWKRWLAKNGDSMDPVEFGEHLELTALDLIPAPQEGDPGSAALLQLADRLRVSFGDPSDIIDLARGFKVNVDRVVEAVTTLQSGETSITYKESHETGGGKSGGEKSSAKAPGLFCIAIPRFEGDKMRYRVAVKLRYRPTSGGIKWRYELHNIEDIDRAAWDGVAQQLASKTRELTEPLEGEQAEPFPVFIGQPEGRATP